MDEALKNWLQPDKKDKYNAYCKVCNKTIKITASKMQLYRHVETTMHQRLSKETKKQTSLLNITKSLVNQNELKKRTDLYLAAHIAEHNLS